MNEQENPQDAWEGDNPRPMQRRSIRQISKGPRANASTPQQPASPMGSMREESSLYPERRYKSARKMSWGIWAGGAFILIFAFLAVSALGAGATVLVYPKTVDVTLSNERIELAPPGSGEDLSYETITLSKEASESVEATGEEYVEERAQGTITIYNDFDENEQELVATTRFRTPDGKIYRIPEAVVVPGKTGNTPGSVTTIVVADEAGEEYNIGPTRFEIPGFEGTERFDGFYAESEGNMEGGFAGETLVVSDEDAEVVRGALEEKLRDELLAQARTDLPSNIMILEDQVELSFVDLPNRVKGESVEVRLQGNLTAGVVDKNKIASVIAEDRVDDYDGNPVRFEPEESITIRVVDGSASRDVDEEESDEEETEEAAQIDSVTIEVSGTGSIVWIFDEEKLQGELRGASVGEVEDIARSYSAIERIDLDIKPFWRRSLPESEEEFTIETVLEEEE